MNHNQEENTTYYKILLDNPCTSSTRIGNIVTYEQPKSRNYKIVSRTFIKNSTYSNNERLAVYSSISSKSFHIKNTSVTSIVAYAGRIQNP